MEEAEKHGAIMMVDDAHASGVLRKGSAGTVDHFGLHALDAFDWAGRKLGLI